MNCEQFENLAHAIARGDLQDATLARSAADHAASCASCDALLAEAYALNTTLAKLAAHDKAVHDAANLESSLRASYHHVRSMNALPPRRSKRWALAGAAVALAAAILLGVLLIPHFMHRNAPPENLAIARVAPVAPKSAAPPASGENLQAVHSGGVNTQTATHTVSHHPKKNGVKPEKTLTGFMLLPYADAPSTIRYGTLVRLSLSRRELAYLGLPVTVSDTAEKTVADLFVNESGTPEAIRLVR